VTTRTIVVSSGTKRDVPSAPHVTYAPVSTRGASYTVPPAKPQK
jgi:hypothetical protein